MKQSFSALQTLTLRILKNTLTNPEVLVPSLAGPIFMLVAFAGGLSGLAQLPTFSFAVGYASFVFAALLFQAAGFSGSVIGGTIAVEFESGFIRRLILALPNQRIILWAYVIAAAVQALFVFGLLTLLGIPLGVRFVGSPAEITLLILMALFFNYVAVLWGLGIAMFYRSSDGGMLANMPFLAGIFLSPFYLPLSLLQGWVKSVATYNPVTPLLETGRDLISGQPTDAAVALTVLVVLILLSTAWGMWSLRRAARFA